ncbi:flagellar protein FliT [Clostridioides sp. ES-S-0108-01]|uniref:flagellar protein FliT n=1 Tax=Clostridioides sp. ES-S-0108-01 TaxID=2770773 RepID=UPI001D0C396B|nr:flagellar protein FliT [Clostridioides sp. ES-S-0108-01]UDN51447.1 flagellar protein FliT [Clostridioides sp. ES-S-0107-01]
MGILGEKLVLYREISLQIINLIDKEEYQYISNKLNDRQKIINSIDENDKESFISIYVDMKLIDIDNKIQNALQKNLLEVKKELHKYKLTKQVNTIYSKLNREKVNIFSKKV